MARLDEPIKTPVLFLVFNRQDTVRRVWEVIRQVQPSHLFIAADGPRKDRDDDVEKCQNVRQIVNQIDWDCEVKRLFRDENLGCGIAVASAIDWFFENVEYGIILEDDCLPHPSFFRFCQELLERYRYDERIKTISGDNFQSGHNLTPYSYYFSRYNHSWGWATWRRAWKCFDLQMSLWPEIREQGLLSGILKRQGVIYWTKIFDKVYQGTDDIWDYQWTFSCWSQNGLSILPNVNLVTNIGFCSNEATHTRGKGKGLSIPSDEMVFPLRHPPFIMRNGTADDFTDRNVFRISFFRESARYVRSLYRHAIRRWQEKDHAR